jgi:hypothetical protein
MILSINRKIQICIGVNLFIVIITILIILNNADKGLLKIGYSNELYVIGVQINTLDKYLMLHFCIFFIEFCYSIIYEYANPIMYFNVFNVDKKNITEFNKNELQLYAQSLWFLCSIKQAFMILVSITQLDITIAKVVYNEIAVAIVIRVLLNNKTFKKSAIILDETKISEEMNEY